MKRLNFLNRAQQNVPEISVGQAHDLCESGTFLLDVREQNEIEEGSAKGSYHIPMGEIENRINEIPSDKPVMVICRSGRRSMMVAKLLKSKGFSEVKNVQGGFNEWRVEGLPEK